MSALHAQGKWVINPMSDSYRVLGSWQTWITHKCRKVSGKNYYYLVDLPSKRCPTCGAPIPREIFEAWKQQNYHMKRYL